MSLAMATIEIEHYRFCRLDMTCRCTCVVSTKDMVTDESGRNRSEYIKINVLVDDVQLVIVPSLTMASKNVEIVGNFSKHLQYTPILTERCRAYIFVDLKLK